MRHGRGDRIRTCDLPLPKRALYQAELRPESTSGPDQAARTASVKTHSRKRPRQVYCTPAVNFAQLRMRRSHVHKTASIVYYDNLSTGVIPRSFRGCSLVVKPLSSKQMMRVRFSSAPPNMFTSPCDLRCLASCLVVPALSVGARNVITTSTERWLFRCPPGHTLKAEERPVGTKYGSRGVADTRCSL